MDENLIPNQMEEDELDEVVLLDENGQEVRFDHLLTFYHEQEKYIALLPIDDVENIEEGAVILLHVVTKNDEDVYETIENEVLLEEVFEAFMELFEELLDEED